MGEVRVLIVHAKRAGAEMLRTHLVAGDPNAQLRVAFETQDVLELALEFEADVLVLGDVFPAGPSGVQACRHIRRDPALAGLGILMVTSGIGRGEEWRVLLGAADLCIPLPGLTAEMLQTNVEQLATHVRRRRADRIDAGAIVIDQDSREAHLYGRLLELGPAAFEALRRLALRSGRTLSHRGMLGLGEGAKDLRTTGLAHLRAHDLRAAFGDARDLLRTVHSKGYCLLREPGATPEP